MRVGVVGAGLIGSAAARHLALAGHDVTLIGPGEPADFASHPGVFASHYDEGRITRSLDPHPFWSAASRASIARYAEIEAASGIPFFSDVGSLIVGPPGDFMDAIAADRASADVVIEDVRAPRHRDLAWRFSPETHGTYEAHGAGHISPRRLVAAQQRISAALGVQRVEAVARGVSGTCVTTDAGTIEADHIVVAAGGFTPGLLSELPPMQVYARTVLFMEVTEEVAAQLGRLPSLIYMDAGGTDIYALPPIRYPDGKLYIKIGGDPVNHALSPDEVAPWFRSGGRPEVGAYLEGVLRALLPDVPMSRSHIAPCVTSFTGDGLPYIGPLHGRLTVATAGTGKAAKCSDELGRLAARAVEGDVDPLLAPQR
ncbi:MAG: NAD(P)/FAD-dependent oxidoreductase [Shimia sp.]